MDEVDRWLVERAIPEIVSHKQCVEQTPGFVELHAELDLASLLLDFPDLAAACQTNLVDISKIIRKRLFDLSQSLQLDFLKLVKSPSAVLITWSVKSCLSV